MELLNDDCIFEILRYLSLKDQISLHQVCTFMGCLIKSFWCRKYKRLKFNFQELTLAPDDLKIFFKVMQDSIEAFQLKSLTKDAYDVLKLYVFPNAGRLRVNQMPPPFLTDEHMLELRHVFPNLKSFCPHGQFTGQHLNLWTSLEELTLTFCSLLDASHFYAIIKDVKLKKLCLNIFPNLKHLQSLTMIETKLTDLCYLRVNTYELYHFLKTPMPLLDTLIVANRYNPIQLMDAITFHWKNLLFTYMETANTDNILECCMQLNLPVESLCINNDSKALSGDIIQQLHKVIGLRQLRFCNCRLEIEHIYSLIMDAEQLEDISFETCQCDSSKLVLEATTIGAKRSKKLTVNFYDNFMQTMKDNEKQAIGVKVQLYGIHPLFELTNYRGENLYYEPMYLVFKKSCSAL